MLVDAHGCRAELDRLRAAAEQQRVLRDRESVIGWIGARGAQWAWSSVVRASASPAQPGKREAVESAEHFGEQEFQP